MTPKEVVALVRAMGLFDDRLESGVNAYGTALRRTALSGKTPIAGTDLGYIYRAEPATFETPSFFPQYGAAESRPLGVS